ncbi:MAG: DUF2726 domain-containing protein, partial [Paracoccaceae bacterium]
ATPALNLSDPRDQMLAIARVTFITTPLLNKEEARLLPLLESCTRAARKGQRVMAQTSLGEIIRPSDGSGTDLNRKQAYASINSKRLDFAVIDCYGHLSLAIEYQGSGHYQNHSFMRDAVKREVLRKAGVPYLEVEQDFDSADLRRRVMQILAPAPAPLAPVPDQT